MRAARRALAFTFTFTFTFTFAFAFSGCSAVVASHDHECTVDSDCAGRFDGGVYHCTHDNLCVPEVPEDSLCTELVGADPADPNTVMIGGLFRLSGMSGDKDTEMANAARMAMSEIVQTNQRQLGMVICDIAAGSTDPAIAPDPTVAARSFAKAVTKYHVVSTIGPTTSGSVFSVAPLVAMYNVLVVTPSATSPAISGMSSLVWRTCASDALQGDVLAAFIPSMSGPTGSMHASVVNTAYVDTAYGNGLNTSFSAAWSKKSGAGPVSTTRFTTPANTDMVVTRLSTDSPDFSLIVADEDASRMMGSLYSHGSMFKSTSEFLFTDGALGPSLLGTSPDLNVCKRVFGTAPGTPPPSTPPGINFGTFRNAYKDRFMGADPANTSFVANAYDATYVVALVTSGMPSGQPITGGALAALMMKLSGPGPTVNVGPVDFVQGVRDLRQGGSIDFVGASGDLTWDNATGDPTDAPIEVWGIDTTRTPPQICILQPSTERTCP